MTDTSQSVEERTLRGMSPQVAGLLCYVGGWISGIVFLVLEQKNRFVRFHAMQSIIVFGILTLASAFFSWMPVAGPFLSWSIAILSFILWLILIIKASSGELFKLPWAGDLAEKLAAETTGQVPEQPPSWNDTPVSGEAEPVPPLQTQKRRSASRDRYYSTGARAARTIGSSFVIAWSVVLLIFFNFFSQYIAYYVPSGNYHWQVYPLLTGEYNTWLPILNTALVASIVGHILIIIFDNRLFNRSIHLILNILSLITILALLIIFPFNFSAIPDSLVAFWAKTGLTITLVIISVGMTVGTLVRIIQLIVDSIRSAYSD